ncbi:MAG: S-layer homology domain-containing protein [Bacteroidetes bacterium]|nr:S-layer homology domain-containing protein [Bacteroidota bacterium]
MPSLLFPRIAKVKTRMLIVLISLFSLTVSYSQTITDGFDYPIGNHGYDADSFPVPVDEKLNPENNTLYPSNPVANPDRFGTGPGWYNASDVGNFYSHGLHPAEDWNYNSGGADKGKPVTAVANGEVVMLKETVQNDYQHAGWVMVIKHITPENKTYYSVYIHITSASETDGILVSQKSAFTFQEGNPVRRGDTIARISRGNEYPGTGHTLPTHLHFEMRNSNYDGGSPLYAHDDNTGYYTHVVGQQFTSLTQAQVVIAFQNMALDGIIDPSDFIDANRPGKINDGVDIYGGLVSSPKLVRFRFTFPHSDFSISNIIIGDNLIPVTVPVSPEAISHYYSFPLQIPANLAGCSNGYSYDISFNLTSNTTGRIFRYKGKDQLYFQNYTGFSDVGESSWFKSYVSEGVSNGLFKGNGPTTFNPEGLLTRAQMAKVIVNAAIRLNLLRINTSTDDGIFDDVPATHWAFPYVQTLRNNDCISHDAAHKNFNPNDQITAAEFSKILCNALIITDDQINQAALNGGLGQQGSKISVQCPDQSLQPSLSRICKIIDVRTFGNYLFAEPLSTGLYPATSSDISGPQIVITGSNNISRSLMSKIILNSYHFAESHPPSSSPNKTSPTSHFSIVGDNLELIDIPTGTQPDPITVNANLTSGQSINIEYPGSTWNGLPLFFYWSVDGGTLISAASDHRRVTFTAPATPGSTTFHLHSSAGTANGMVLRTNYHINVIGANTTMGALITNVTTCPGQVTVPVNVTNCYGVAAISLSFTFNSSLLTYIGYQSVNQALTNAPNSVYTINAVGNTLYFTWASSDAVNLGGETLFELIFSASPGTAGISFQTSPSGSCEFSDVSGTPLTVTYTNGNVTGLYIPVITQQPVNKTIIAGQSTSFYTGASGSSLTYQWQVNSGSGWTDLTNGSVYSGATASTLSLTNVTLGMSTYQYRCRVSGACPQALTSGTAGLTVNPVPPVMSASIVSRSVCPGTVDVPVIVTNFSNMGSFSLVLSMSNSLLTFNSLYYQNPALSGGLITINPLGNKIYISWASGTQVSMGNDTLLKIRFSCESGTTTLSWDNSLPGNCEFTDINGNTIQCTFNAGNVTTYSIPVITQHPQDRSIISATNTSFSVGAGGTGLGYLWQYSTNGGSSWADVPSAAPYSGVTSAGLSITAASISLNGYRYRCRVSGTCPQTLYSNSATLTVNPPPQQIDAKLINRSYCPGTVSAPVYLVNGNNIAAFSLTLTFSTTILTCNTQLAYTNPSLSGGSIVSNVIGNKVYVSWASATAVNLGNDTLLKFSFTAVPGSSSLSWDNAVSGACEFSNTDGNSIITNYTNATLSIYSPPSITTQPVNKTVIVGQNTSFSLGTAGSGLTYQWQESVNNGSTWNSLTNVAPYSGVTSATLTISNIQLTMNGNRYRCTISGYCPSALTSQSAMLTVNPQPQQINVASGTISNSCTSSLSIPVTVTNFNGIGSFSMTLTYPTNKMTFTGFTELNGNLSSGQFLVNPAGGNLYISWMNASAISVGNATLVKLSFTATTTGSISVGWDTPTPGNCDITDIDGNSILTTWQAGAISVASNPLMVNAGPDSFLVPGNTVSLLATVSGGTSPFTYVWAPSTGLNSATIPNPTAQPSTTTNYIVTVTGANSCSATDNVTVEVCEINNPSADPEVNTATCYLMRKNILDIPQDVSYNHTTSITRAQLAKVAFLGLFGNDIEVVADNFPCPFNDLQTNSYYYRYAKALSYLEYTDGRSPFDRNRFNFSPKSNISRVLVLKVLLETFNIPPNSGGANPFPSDPDVVALQTSNPLWFGYIVSAANKNIITTANSLFHPNDLCSREAAFLMLYRMINGNPLVSIPTVVNSYNPLTSSFFIPGNYTPFNISTFKGLESGNFNHYTRSSFSIPGRNVSLDFSHTYNSFETELPDEFYPIKPLGKGWTHTYNAFISMIDGDSAAAYRLIVHWPDGSLHIYRPVDGIFIPETKGVYDTMLVTTPNGGLLVTIRSKTNVDFSFRKIGNYTGALLMTGITDRNNNSISISYDSLIPVPRIKEVTDPAGRRLQFSYFGNSQQLKEVQDPVNRKISFTFNSDSMPSSFRDAKNQYTHYYYGFGDDERNLLDSIILPKGNRIMNTYADHKLVSTSNTANPNDQLNLSYEFSNYQYPNSAAYLKTTVTEPMQNITTRYSINKYGNITQIDGNPTINISTSFDPDAADPMLPTSITDNLTEVTVIPSNYDAMGNPQLITTSGGGITTTETIHYNSFSDVTEHTNARGFTTHFEYDASGNLHQITDAVGKTSTMTYNSYGQLISSTNPNHVVVEYEYNSEGNLKKITLPALNISSSYTYDGVSRMVSSENFKGYVSRSGYDPNDNKIYDINEAGDSTQYGYDSNDNLVFVRNANGDSTRLNYDFAHDRLLTESFQGAIKQYSYFDDGRLHTMTDPNGHVFNYNYDPSGRITYDGYTIYTYDQQGRAKTFTHNSNTLTLSYDGFNRVKTVTFDDFPGNVITYEYDKNNNVTRLVYPGNKAVEYTYDESDRMETVKDWNNQVTTYTFRDDGLLTSMVYPNGVQTIYKYDTIGRQIGLTTKRVNNSIIADYLFDLDNLGYHKKEHLTEPFSSYPYLQEDTILSTYNPANRILIAGNMTFSYDANGNNKTKTGYTYSYDLKNNITGISGNYNISYDYDGLGNRRRKGNTRFALDVLGTSQVLMETDLSGNPQNYYVYGLGLISRVSPANATNYYISDFRGSIVAMTDESTSATITQKYQYDEFGKILQISESNYNPFRYVGKYGVMYEDSLNYFMRARYYDPEIGRFMSEDPIYSGNKYPYSSNNPINFIDYDGQFFVACLVVLGVAYIGTEIADALFNFVDNSHELSNTKQTAELMIPKKTDEGISLAQKIPAQYNSTAKSAVKFAIAANNAPTSSSDVLVSAGTSLITNAVNKKGSNKTSTSSTLSFGKGYYNTKKRLQTLIKLNGKPGIISKIMKSNELNSLEKRQLVTDINNF